MAHALGSDARRRQQAGRQAEGASLPGFPSARARQIYGTFPQNFRKGGFVMATLMKPKPMVPVGGMRPKPIMPKPMPLPAPKRVGWVIEKKPVSVRRGRW